MDDQRDYAEEAAVMRDYHAEYEGEADECQWWAMCFNPATGTEPHPILGPVPICDRCQSKAHALRDAGRR